VSRLWRFLFFLLLGLLALGALLGALAWKNRADLARLVVEEPEAPRPRPARPEPAVPPAPAVPAPAVPAPRSLSWEGLRVRPYEGRLAADIEAMRRMGDLDQLLLDAVKDLKDGPGLFPSASDRAEFVPLDYAACTFREPFALRPAPGGGARVEFAAEPVVLGWWPARALLAAALCRVILEKEAPGFAAAPEWFKAGAVLHLTDLGEVYETRQLLESQKPPLQRVGPLADGLPETWLCGYWAFEAFRARRGDAAVKAVLGAMRTGDWRAGLQAGGESPEEFERGYRAWVVSYLKDRTAGREAFLDAVTLLRRRREAEAAPLLAAFVKERPLDLYAGEARYYLAYARYRLGEYDEAARGFADLLVNAPQTTSFQSKAHFFAGRCYQLQGYGPMASPEYAIAAFEPANPLLVRLAQQRLESLQ